MVNLKVSVEDMKRITDTASGAIAKRSPVPEYELLRLVAKENELWAMAGNGNFNIQAVAPAKVLTPGSCLIDYDQLEPLLLMEDEGELRIEIIARPIDELKSRGRLAIEGRSSARLAIMGDAAFPRRKTGSELGQVTLSEEAVRALFVVGTVKANASYLARSLGVKDGHGITVDMHGGCSTILNLGCDPGIEFLGSLSYFGRAMKATGETTFTLCDNGAKISSGGAFCQFANESAPPVLPEMLMDQPPPEYVLFVDGSLKHVMGAVRAFARTGNVYQCKFRFDGAGNIEFRANTTESNIETYQIPVRVEKGEGPYEGMFRAEYLYSAASDIGEGFYIELFPSPKKRDVLYIQFRKDSVRHVFMAVA